MTDTELVRVARAVADPTRLRILRTIVSGGSPCCGDISQAVPVRQATISHHLRVLADAGLIESQRNGQFVNVRVVPRRLDEFRAALGSVFEQAASPRSGRRPRQGRMA
jgi:ArsR family transcriptional regulator